MKTKKPKRIRALVRWIDIEETIWNAPEWGVRGNPPSEPCYILRQSDIPALAEQMSARIFKVNKDKVLEDVILDALIAHGFAPDKKGGAK